MSSADDGLLALKNAGIFLFCKGLFDHQLVEKSINS